MTHSFADDIRQEYGGRSIRKVARDRPRFSSSGSGNNSGRPQERPARVSSSVFCSDDTQKFIVTVSCL